MISSVYILNYYYFTFSTSKFAISLHKLARNFFFRVFTFYTVNKCRLTTASEGQSRTGFLEFLLGRCQKNCRKVQYLWGSVSTLDRITVTVSAEQHNHEYAYHCLMHMKFPPSCCFRLSITIDNSIKQKPAILLNISIRHTDRSFISVFIFKYVD
jgi:hypothetical protein